MTTDDLELARWEGEGGRPATDEPFPAVNPCPRCAAAFYEKCDPETMDLIDFLRGEE